jgi:Protein of unknown function (DUF1439)
MNIINKSLLIFFYILACTGCASTGPKTFSISEQSLQSKLAQHIDKPITLMKVIHIQLSNPSVKLDEKTNRLNAMIDTQFKSPWLSKALNGKMHISGMLNYIESEQSVILDQAKVESIQINGLDEKHNEALSTLAQQIGGELLSKLPIYRVKPEDLRYGNTDYLPQSFKIIGNQLKVTLSPKPTP